MTLPSLLLPLLGLVLAPLLPGVVNRTKALFAGRRGQPLLQTYYDLGKLLRKGAVYSRTASWAVRAAPGAALAAALVALALLPAGDLPAPLAFPGDLVLFVYVLALGRLAIVLGALDTGSAFEGMGASREVTFAALAEPALLLSLLMMARATSQVSLSGVAAGLDGALWGVTGASLALTAAGLFVVILAENARMPFDDPNTHLELTMIHEVMILDHGGPDLAYLTYGAALKLWVLGGLLVNLVLPIRTGDPWLAATIFLGGHLLLAVAVGVVESTMGRLRLARVPQILVGAGALCLIAVLISLG